MILLIYAVGKKTTSTSWQIGAVMRRRQSHRLQMRTNRTSQWHSQTRPSFFRASTIGLGEMSRKAVVVDRAAFCFLHSGRETGGGIPLWLRQRCESRRICRDQRKAKRPDGVWGKAGRQWGKSHYVEFLGVLWVVLIMLPQVGKVAVSEYVVVVV